MRKVFILGALAAAVAGGYFLYYSLWLARAGWDEFVIGVGPDTATVLAIVPTALQALSLYLVSEFKSWRRAWDAHPNWLSAAILFTAAEVCVVRLGILAGEAANETPVDTAPEHMTAAVMAFLYTIGGELMLVNGVTFAYNELTKGFREKRQPPNELVINPAVEWPDLEQDDRMMEYVTQNYTKS